MLVHPHGAIQLLQQRAVCTLAFGVHGGANIIQHAHDTGGVLQGTRVLQRLSSPVGSAFQVLHSQTYHFIFNEIAHDLVVEVLNGSPFDALLNVLFLRRRPKMSTAFGKTSAMKHQMDTDSTCSAFRVSSMKICCNFSLTKFIQNCSKPFLCRAKAIKSVSDLYHDIHSALSYQPDFCNE